MKKIFVQPYASRSTINPANQRGAAAIVAIILLMAFMVLIVASVSFRGIGDIEIGQSKQVGTTVLLAAETCGEEALLRITRNANYTGGSLDVGEASCTIVVTGNPCGTCTVNAVATQDSWTREIEIDMNRVGNTTDIIRWEEVQ